MNKKRKENIITYLIKYSLFHHLKNDLSDCDIAIGTTAGIGRGGISIITNEYEITTTTNVYADLCENNSEKLFQRSEDGIRKTLEIILLLLNNNIDKITSLENIEIRKIV
ncbi:MAG: FeGP cofactor biosynthesis protein HcgF family protein [Methanobrevibacter sp.]